MNDNTLTLRQAAKLLGIRVRTAREWVVKKKLAAVKNDSGYRWMVPESEINRVLEERNNADARGEYSE